MAVHGAYDSNGDDLGDFEGIRQKLDYFKDMGISGYRFQHVGVYGDDYKWSGLVQQDWYNVDPHYGTMEDFERLMKDCEEKDVKIMMMAVPEYVGWHHPDYIGAKEAKEKCIDDSRLKWFEWNDDGTVLTCWDRPAPDCSNSEYMDAFLKHIGFWMDKGVAGWDVDAVPTWRNLNLDSLRKFTEYVIKRNGLITAENMVLQDEIMKYGGFNAGNGYIRHLFYNELQAMTKHNVKCIREALKVREELIGFGMFPYQQFGDDTYNTIVFNSNRLEMFKLQVAFNAVLPDQVWIQANVLTLSDRPETFDLKPNNGGWGSIDWEALCEQEKSSDSPLSHIKRLFSLRAKNKELNIGEIEELTTNYPEDVFAVIRISEDSEERALVIFNFSDQTKDVVIYFEDYSIRSFRNYINGEKIDLISNSLKIKLNFYGYKLLKILK